MKLYHYTSVNNLLNMLEKSIIKDENTNVTYLKLKASHCSNLEDKNEYKLFTDKLKEKVKEYALKENCTLGNKEIENLDKFCQCHLYTTSLTDKKNCSYMWEHYGDNHTGVCIEFDFDDTPPFYWHKNGYFLTENAFKSMLTKCKYVNPEELEIEEKLIVDIYQSIINGTKNDNDIIKDAAILARLKNLAIMYKRTEFFSESEYRFALGCIESSKRIEFPIPISAISSIILEASIENAAKHCIIQKISDILGDFVSIRMSNTHNEK